MLNLMKQDKKDLEGVDFGENGKLMKSDEGEHKT